MDDAAKMARSAAETAAQLDQAKREVRFAANLLPSADGAAKGASHSATRRRSTIAPATDGTPGDENATRTLTEDDAKETWTLPDLHQWLRNNNDALEFNVSPGQVRNDLQAVVESLAVYYGKRGDSPGFQFDFLTEEAQAALNSEGAFVDWARFKSLITHDDPEKQDEKLHAVFLELKLRHLLLAAALSQSEELHKIATNLGKATKDLRTWAEYFGAQNKDCLRRIALAEDEIQKGEEHCREHHTDRQDSDDEEPTDKHGPPRKKKTSATAGNGDPGDGSSSDSDSDDSDHRDKTRRDAMKDALDIARKKIREQEEELVGLRAAVVRMAVRERAGTPGSVTTTASMGGSKSSRLADVPMFYNEEAKDTTTFETWYRNIQNKLSGNADHFPTDSMRMTYIEGRLGGRAAADLQPYLRDTHPDQIRKSQALLKHLWNEYFDDNVREDSLKAYNRLEYKPGDDIRVFKNEFVRLAGEIRRNKESWKEEFNSRLSTNLQTTLTRDYIDDNVGFEDFARLAVKIVGNWKRSRDREPEQSSKKTSGIGNRRDRDGKKNQSGRRSGGHKDTAKTGAPGLEKPTTEEAIQLKAEGKCYLCRKRGHIAKYCGKGAPAMDETAQVNALIERLYKESQSRAVEEVEEVDDESSKN